MPRIFTSANDPIDFCADCFPSEESAFERYGNIGDGPDGRGNCFGWDTEHPAYDGHSMYRCQKCRKILAETDEAVRVY